MEVRARAPGKIILSGEHAVVHGSTAIAASIDLYTQVTLQKLSDSENGEGLLKLQLKDMGLEFLWSITRIKERLRDLSTPLPSQPMACSSECTESIAALVEEQNIPEAKVGLASGVLAFLWLYISIQGLKPATVVVTSDLPLGSGLGSSASFCVALCGALLAQSDVTTLDLSPQGWLTFGESELELVNKWAFEGEKIIHGKPSGIDNTVSTFGNMIMFKLGKLTCIKSGMPLRMLITNTKVGRNTKALVAGVSERASRHPDAMSAVFSAVDYISKEFSTIIQSPVHDDLSVIEKEEKIEELMEMNQGLLQSMGVSHASIETVLRTTLKYKLSSKLTGAGGGGCVLTFLPALLSATVVDKVIAELKSCGFECLIAGIGVKGLEICFGGSS
ncbi:mevalonate kinase [Telopea speciosissima]|uniref:mevalonate kinase n=1 Tax=Telopea speciosissima TaxID=54955 RepID=UPI001CC7783A|nr:mevalonate kinase [Telopea speciosissima]XP_043695947.1 mevalonate kinase [Telopea speciosissima]XP_043695948.1 mevalonate kinase [Telopea speciosissima]XP_043695949.1 mevalonate kinase [Telopea speciosissima]